MPPVPLLLFACGRGSSRGGGRREMEVVLDEEVLPPLEDHPELPVLILWHADEPSDGERYFRRIGSGEGELTEGADGGGEDNKNKSKCLWHELRVSARSRCSCRCRDAFGITTVVCLWKQQQPGRWKEGMEVVPDKEALPPLEDQPELSVPVLRHADEVGDGEGSIGTVGSDEGELTEGADGDKEDIKNKSKCLWHPGRWKEGMEVVPDKEELPPLEDQPELPVLVLQHADEAGNGEGSVV
ncbi:hypothetical protein B296_00027502 [Ensete ventricosum]|uniref:Uncharacterized protein n=1 Tax=Ensete ventricosum TaxID=4639 RepID=A0A426ZJL7_ENSVE|nr:hypothetical protein B296_00027502 [Ensete ventricosum]